MHIYGNVYYDVREVILRFTKLLKAYAKDRLTCKEKNFVVKMVCMELKLAVELLHRYFFWWIRTWLVRGIKPFIDMYTLNSKQIYGK